MDIAHGKAAHQPQTAHGTPDLRGEPGPTSTPAGTGLIPCPSPNQQRISRIRWSVVGYRLVGEVKRLAGVKLTEFVVALTLTMGTAGTMAHAIDIPTLVATTKGISAQVNCRMVDSAIAAYTAEHDTSPTQIAEIRPYLTGDISDYSIVAGAAAGHGCSPR
jgi:hypothetical protein